MTWPVAFSLHMYTLPYRPLPIALPTSKSAMDQHFLVEVGVEEEEEEEEERAEGVRLRSRCSNGGMTARWGALVNEEEEEEKEEEEEGLLVLLGVLGTICTGSTVGGETFSSSSQQWAAAWARVGRLAGSVTSTCMMKSQASSLMSSEKRIRWPRSHKSSSSSSSSLLSSSLKLRPKGVFPCINSYAKTPAVHRSTLGP